MKHPLEARAADITEIEVVPWELDRKEYGVAYRTRDGKQHRARVGSKAEAAALVQRIRRVQPTEVTPFNAANPARVGAPWTTQDDAALLDYDDNGRPMEAAAAHLGRTTAECTARLEVLRSPTG
jgi:hypothetical protein